MAGNLVYSDPYVNEPPEIVDFESETACGPSSPVPERKRRRWSATASPRSQLGASLIQRVECPQGSVGEIWVQRWQRCVRLLAQTRGEQAHVWRQDCHFGGHAKRAAANRGFEVSSPAAG